MNDSGIIHGFIGMCLNAQGVDPGYYAGTPKDPVPLPGSKGWKPQRALHWPNRRPLVTGIPMAYFAVGMQIAQMAEFLAECSERFCTPQFDIDIDDIALASKYLDPETGEVSEA